MPLGSPMDTLPLCRTWGNMGCIVLSAAFLSSVQTWLTAGICPSSWARHSPVYWGIWNVNAWIQYTKWPSLWHSYSTIYKWQYCTSGLCHLISPPSHWFGDGMVSRGFFGCPGFYTGHSWPWKGDHIGHPSWHYICAWATNTPPCCRTLSPGLLAVF